MCFLCLQVFEKFTKESTSLLDELSIINDSDKSSTVDKEKYGWSHSQSYSLRCSNSRQIKSRAVSLCPLQIS